ncbi:MAG: methionyl-tRNA formyltransferase [Ideonella sp.]|nr:methionyl-tRNA formyltransferase [Ideonella sp.]MCC7456525.1 methionyl-tRNA formyltransferase [Nitrospira sp.]
MKLAFAGTPEFAAAALRAILAAGHDVGLVLTQPDRPAGRGMRLQASAVKQLALARQLPLLQPAGLRLDGRHAADAAAARAALTAAAPEVLVVAAYGLLLPPWLLALPRHGCINIHASLLPRWRGAAPIQRAIEAGDARTGITIMQMDQGLDTGDMLLVADTPIGDDDTAATLHDRLAVLGARLIVEALQQLSADALPAKPQPPAGATHAAKIDKREAALDWRHDAATLERRVRAFDPFPGATLSHGGTVLKLWRARALADRHGRPGTVLSTLPGPLVVACGRGALELLELQRPGGRRVPAAQAFAAGPPTPGQSLGPAADQAAG